MFRFFKKKPDPIDPVAADQQADPEAGQPAPEAGYADLSADSNRVFEPNVDPQPADEGLQSTVQSTDQIAPAAENASPEAPRVGLLSRWFKRNPEPPPGGELESKPEDSVGDEAVETPPEAVEEDDFVGDAWKGDRLDAQAEEPDDVGK